MLHLLLDLLHLFEGDDARIDRLEAEERRLRVRIADAARHDRTRGARP